MDFLGFLIGLLVSGLVLVPIAFFLAKRTMKSQVVYKEADVSTQQAEATRLILDAETRKREILLESRDEALKIRTESEQEVRQRRNDLSQQERRLLQKEETLDRRIEQSERREQGLVQKEKEVEQVRVDIGDLHKKARETVERIATMTASEAKAVLLQEIDDEVWQDANRRVREIETKPRKRQTSGLERSLRWQSSAAPPIRWLNMSPRSFIYPARR